MVAVLAAPFVKSEEYICRHPLTGELLTREGAGEAYRSGAYQATRFVRINSATLVWNHDKGIIKSKGEYLILDGYRIVVDDSLADGEAKLGTNEWLKNHVATVYGT